MPKQIETSTISGVITTWYDNRDKEKPTPSKFMLDVGEQEVELTIWPDRASQTSIRDSLDLLDPDDLVNKTVNATVELPASDYLGKTQYRVLKIKPGKMAESQIKEEQAEPSESRKVTTPAYSPTSRSEIGAATGNGRNGGYTLVAEYYKKHGELPNDEWLIACAERVDFFTNALMNPPTPELPAPSDDDIVGVISLDDGDADPVVDW